MYLSERIYSTGNYYLDEVLDSAFYDGMNYAQREFGVTKGAMALAKRELAKKQWANAFKNSKVTKEGYVDAPFLKKMIKNAEEVSVGDNFFAK